MVRRALLAMDAPTTVSCLRTTAAYLGCALVVDGVALGAWKIALTSASGGSLDGTVAPYEDTVKRISLAVVLIVVRLTFAVSTWNAFETIPSFYPLVLLPDAAGIAVILTAKGLSVGACAGIILVLFALGRMMSLLVYILEFRLRGIPSHRTDLSDATMKKVFYSWYGFIGHVNAAILLMMALAGLMGFQILLIALSSYMDSPYFTQNYFESAGIRFGHVVLTGIGMPVLQVLFIGAVKQGFYNAPTNKKMEAQMIKERLIVIASMQNQLSCYSAIILNCFFTVAARLYRRVTDIRRKSKVVQDQKDCDIEDNNINERDAVQSARIEDKNIIGGISAIHFVPKSEDVENVASFRGPAGIVDALSPRPIAADVSTSPSNQDGYTPTPSATLKGISGVNSMLCDHYAKLAAFLILLCFAATPPNSIWASYFGTVHPSELVLRYVVTLVASIISNIINMSLNTDGSVDYRAGNEYLGSVGYYRLLMVVTLARVFADASLFLIADSGNIAGLMINPMYRIGGI